MQGRERPNTTSYHGLGYGAPRHGSGDTNKTSTAAVLSTNGFNNPTSPAVAHSAMALIHVFQETEKENAFAAVVLTKDSYHAASSSAIVNPAVALVKKTQDGQRVTLIPTVDPNIPTQDPAKEGASFFLKLSGELSNMIYEYALTTPKGLYPSLPRRIFLGGHRSDRVENSVLLDRYNQVSYVDSEDSFDQLSYVKK